MLLAEIVIPQFITRVQISSKRRKKYWKLGKKQTVESFYESLPKRHKDKKLDRNGYLIDEKGRRVVSNPIAAGTPKYEILSGNNLLSGYGNPNIRAKLVKSLREFYRPHVQEYIKQHGPIEKFPLRVEWDVYTTVPEDPTKASWDAGNLFFYYKYFEDSLHKDAEINEKYLALIPEDKVVYITHPPGPKIIPIDNWEDRKFIFKFYHDDRPELRRKPWI